MARIVRMHRGLAAAAAIVCVALGGSATAASARTTAGFGFATSSVETENCVEQQSNGLQNCGSPTAVLNPTRCIWTVDQYTIDTASGAIAANTAATDQMCLISDGITNWWGEPHWVSVYVTSVKNNLAVTLSNSLGDAWTMQPVATKSGFAWSLCVPGATAGSYATIPNSNGGYGTEVDYSLTVRNTTAQSARTVSGQFEIQGTTGPC